MTKLTNANENKRTNITAKALTPWCWTVQEAAPKLKRRSERQVLEAAARTRERRTDTSPEHPKESCPERILHRPAACRQEVVEPVAVPVLPSPARALDV